MPKDRTQTDLAHFISEIPCFEMVPHLIRLVARGKPVPIADIAAASGLPVADVEAALRDQPGTDWDDHGDVVGFGLTLRPTAHRFTVSDTTLYTFCATDALFFPAILGEPAVVESNCPATGRTIQIELTPHAVVSVNPHDTVVSQLVDLQFLGDVRGNVCDQGHFFASADAACAWLAAHPGGQVLTVSDAFEQSRSAGQSLGWLAPEGSKQ
jgi:alkylmercury lyase